MSQSGQCPALLIYEDGTGRLVVTSDLPAMLDEVSTRYLIGDILIDRRGRVFELAYASTPNLVVAALCDGRAPPIEVTARYSDEDVDRLVMGVVGLHADDLTKMQDAIEFARSATW